MYKHYSFNRGTKGKVPTDDILSIILTSTWWVSTRISCIKTSLFSSSGQKSTVQRRTAKVGSTAKYAYANKDHWNILCPKCKPLQIESIRQARNWTRRWSKILMTAQQYPHYLRKLLTESLSPLESLLTRSTLRHSCWTRASAWTVWRVGYTHLNGR